MATKLLFQSVHVSTTARQYWRMLPQGATLAPHK